MLPTFRFGIVVVGLWSGSLAADDWPQFRGPNCTGISRTSRDLPVTFSSTDNVAWTVDVGDGIGSPVVAAGRVFVTGMMDDETLGVFALDLQSGNSLWRRTWDVGTLPEIHETNSHASTTVAANADRIFFYFSSLGMIALDAQTGDDVWHRKLPVPFFVFKWGPGMSPVLHEHRLFFCQDDDLYPALYAFDEATGEILWKDDRYDMAVNYSHPVLCETPDGEELVVAGTGMLIGYDLTTGRRKWFAKSLLRNIKTTPVSRDGIVYVSLQSGGIANQWLASADQVETGNNDGKLSKDEIEAIVGVSSVPPAFYERTFRRGDLNEDGVLEGQELDLAFLHPNNFAGARFDAADPADERIQAVRGGGVGDVTETHVLWNHVTRHTDHIVSPLILEQQMLLVKGGGITTLFSTGDGEPLRGPKRIPNTCDYFASPVCGDGKIYVAGANGTVVVLSVDNKLAVLAKNDFGESILATPAIAESSLLFRTRTKLYCVRSL